MLLAGTSSGMYGFSPRAGGGWDASVVAFKGEDVVAIATTEGNLLAAVGGQGVHESADGGLTWIPQLEKVNPECLAVAPDGAVYLGADPAAIHVRRPGAETFDELDAIRQLPSYPSWNFPNPPHLGNIHDLAFSAHDPNTIYAAVEVGGVIVSRDSGETWEELREGLHLDVHGLVSAPGNGTDVLYAATGQGFFRSEDNGRTWESACNGFRARYLVPVAVHSERPEVVFTSATQGRPRYWRGRAGGACATIYRSENGGASWRPVMTGLPDTLPGQVEVLAADPSDVDTIYAGTVDGRVLMSRSLGDSWGVVAEGLPPSTASPSGRSASSRLRLLPVLAVPAVGARMERNVERRCRGVPAELIDAGIAPLPGDPCGPSIEGAADIVGDVVGE